MKFSKLSEEYTRRSANTQLMDDFGHALDHKEMLMSGHKVKE